LHQGQIRGALERELGDFVAAARSGIASSTACLRQAIEGLQLGEAIVEASRTRRTVHLN
jgi:predicted dehydrogenase